MRRRQAAGLTTVVVGAIGAAVATAVVLSDEPPKTVDQPVKAVVAALPELPRTYVALGSSYASGSGGDQVSGTRCQQSVDSYPRQIAAALDMRLVDATCSGATTKNILRVPQAPLVDRPQIDAVTRDTDLVTITAGGNDIDYFGRMMAMSCANTGCGRGGPAPEPTAANYKAVQDALVETIGAVRARAPHATIVVVNYPPAVEPSARKCPDLGLTDQQVAVITHVHDELGAATARAAQTAGAVLVDTSKLGADHTVCSAEPWLDGVKSTAPYHPNARGRTAMADLVLAALRA